MLRLENAPSSVEAILKIIDVRQKSTPLKQMQYSLTTLTITVFVECGLKALSSKNTEGESGLNMYFQSSIIISKYTVIAG